MQATGHSIKGRKPAQEDSYLIAHIPGKGLLVLVADGVGGHGHGDFASQLCVAWFKKAFEQQEISDPQAFLRRTAEEVAYQVYQKGVSMPEYKNAGTTLTGFWVMGDQYYWINIGDSRVYLFDRNRQLHQLTKDHSLVQEYVDQGILTPEQARLHPQRNMMFNAIGVPPEDLQVDVAGPFDLHDGDALLATSDGVHDTFSQEKMQEFLQTLHEEPDLMRLLVETSFDAGSKDNITACYYVHQENE